MNPGQNPEDATAELVVEGLTANVIAIDKWSSVFGALDMGSLVLAVDESVDKVRRGNLGDAEGLLMAQGISLNAVFTHLLAIARDTKAVDQFDRLLRLAFKAQAQSRATFETLSVIKNPPVFTRQANIAHGPQQVNNGVLPMVEGLAHAENQKPKQIELLEAKNERMDFGATGKAGAGDKELATVGKVNRTKKRRR